jgi:hypothetical protein
VQSYALLMSSLGKTKLTFMKTVTIISALIALSSLAFFSCQEKSDATTNSDASENSLSWNFDSSFVIDSSEAVGYISDYQDFIDSVVKELAHGDASKEAYYKARLTYGARVYIHELQAMMDTVKAHVPERDRDGDSASLYIMLGSMPSEGDSDSTHAIFCLDSWKNNEGERTNFRSMFFDFVRPCPTSCPSWFRQ